VGGVKGRFVCLQDLFLTLTFHSTSTRSKVCWTTCQETLTQHQTTRNPLSFEVECDHNIELRHTGSRSGWTGSGCSFSITLVLRKSRNSKRRLLSNNSRRKTILLWIEKTRDKDKTYEWMSVRWETKNLFCLLWINKARTKDRVEESTLAFVVYY
jgi:hypothetical protein